MGYKLFVDDERMPASKDWIIARSYFDVVHTVMNYGMPSYVSFDHDLGDPTFDGLAVAKFLVMLDMKARSGDARYSAKFPPDFDYYVHSQNPVGKANIEGYMDSYTRFINADQLDNGPAVVGLN